MPRWIPVLLAAALVPCVFAASGFPELSKRDFTPAGLDPREPELRVDFPGGAAARGVPKGTAVVAVLVDADGKAVDFQIVGCSDPSFGRALLEHARTLSYRPAKFKGTPVPARYDVGYRFESSSVAMGPMEEARQRFGGAGSNEVSAVSESKLDQPLEFTNVALPRVPAGYQGTGDKPPTVLVTFFIDENGEVHVPNVQSADAARLFTPAIAAVKQWRFKAPKSHGKPTTVYAGRSVTFVAREAPPAPGASPAPAGQ